MTIPQGRFGSHRRVSLEVRAAGAKMGGANPILVQSMTTTLTKDIEATVAQTLRLARAGCELVRITTPTQTDAACLEEIVRKVRAEGVVVPICADIHFQPAAAFEAVKWADKVRVNPGNFVDAKTAYGFQKEFGNDVYERGLQKISDKFRPLVKMARERGVALRIGTNHGSLSDRILARHGDTPEGMVVSAMEYLSVCEDEGFDQVVFSMKSSNPRIAIQCYRMLVDRLEQGGHKAYPIHLGVTEAGEGRDGRLKSAVGIGSLLLDGIGDTIRVSLTEDPVEEVPVGRLLADACVRPFAPGALLDFAGRPLETTGPVEALDPLATRRRDTLPVRVGSVEVGLAQAVRVGGAASDMAPNRDREVEWRDSDLPVFELASAAVPAGLTESVRSGKVCELRIVSIDGLASIGSLPASNLYVLSVEPSLGPWGTRRAVAAFETAGFRPPILLRWKLDGTESDELRMAAAVGGLLCDGIGDLVRLEAASGEAVSLSYDLLQCAGARRSKAEFVSCPSCGRTLFDLVTTSARIREKTGHLKDVAIAIMGCIVNGPGEMADADFGYVGGTPGTVNLYVRRDCVRRSVPEAEAPDALVALIKEHGRWTEP